MLLDDLFVNEGQPDSIDSQMIVDGTVTESDLAFNTATQMELDDLHVAFRARFVSGQCITIPDSAVTPLGFNDILIPGVSPSPPPPTFPATGLYTLEDGGTFDSATGTYTPPVPGVYVFTLNVWYGPQSGACVPVPLPPGAPLSAMISKSGGSAPEAQADELVPGGVVMTAGQSVLVTCMVELATGEGVTFSTSQQTAMNLQIDTRSYAHGFRVK
jgi:hypothetical protein